MNEVVSLDAKGVYYSIWAPIFSRRPLIRFFIQLFVSLGALLGTLSWVIAVRNGELSFQSGALLFVPLTLFGTYQAAGILWRLYCQRQLMAYGQKDVAVINDVLCRKKDTELTYWRITLTTHRSDLSITIDITSRSEAEPVRTGQHLHLLYFGPKMYMVT